jgi:hypothetical protein
MNRALLIPIAVGVIAGVGAFGIGYGTARCSKPIPTAPPTEQLTSAVASAARAEGRADELIQQAASAEPAASAIQARIEAAKKAMPKPLPTVGVSYAEIADRFTDAGF